MKDLSHIPTPETSALMLLNGEAIAKGKIRPAIWPVMQDLERRLHVAREALRMVCTFDYDDRQCDNGYGPATVAEMALTDIYRKPDLAAGLEQYKRDTALFA